MIEFLKENYDKIFEIIGYIVSACTVITALTPTKKDDEILAKIVKLTDYFSVVNPNGTTTIKTEQPKSKDGNK